MIGRFIVFGALALLVTTPAQAYIDPGSGSMVLQLVIAGIVGGWFAVKGYWGKIVSCFKKENKETKRS